MSASIVEILGRPQKQTGNHYIYHCPFHHDKDPSFVVWRGREEWAVCFGCGKSYHVTKVYAHVNGCTIEEAKNALGYTQDDREIREKMRDSFRSLLNKALRKLGDYLLEWMDSDEVTEDFKKKFHWLLEDSRREMIVRNYKLGFVPPDVDISDDTFSIFGPYIPEQKTDKRRKFLRPIIGRVVFPVFYPNGSFWGFFGRKVGLDKKDAKYIATGILSGSEKISYRPFYLSERVKAGPLYICEGITDALVARLKFRDIEAVAAGSVTGTNLLKPLRELLKVRKMVKYVYLVPDPDLAGQSSVLKLAEALHNNTEIPIDKDKIFVIKLPEGKDLDEVILEDGINPDTLPRLKLHDFIAELSNIGKNNGKDEVTPQEARLETQATQVLYNTMSWREILEYLEENVEPRDRQREMERIAEIKGVSLKRLEEILREEARKVFFESPERQSYEFLHPVIDYNRNVGVALLGFKAKTAYLGDTVMFDFWILSKPVNDNGREYLSFIITENREVKFNDGVKVIIEEPKYDLPLLEEAWDKEDFQKFSTTTEGKKPDAPRELFDDIENLVKRYIYLEKDEFYKLFTVYIFLTYFYPIFYSIPFVFFFGNKESGKSRSMKLMYRLVFNGLFMERISQAAFGDFFESRGTGLFDQAEILAQIKFADLVSLLAASYTKDTGKRAIVELSGRKRQVRTFNLFGPKIIAAFREPLFDLRDRLLVIPMVKAPKFYPDPTADAENWKLWRGRLFRFFLNYAHSVRLFYDDVLAKNKHEKGGRLIEIWNPLEAIFRFCGFSEEEIENIYKVFEEQNRELSPVIYDTDIRILEVVLELLSQYSANGNAVPLHISEIMKKLNEEGYSDISKKYVEEIIRRNQACVKYDSSSHSFVFKREIVEKRLESLRSGGSAELQDEGEMLPI